MTQAIAQTLIDAAPVGESIADPSMSMWALVLNADIVVKMVMLLLLVASVWCWAIIFEKTKRIRRLQRGANEFEQKFWSGGPLNTLYNQIEDDPPNPMSAMFVVAMREVQRPSTRTLIASESGRERFSARIERVMQVTLVREVERLERYMIFLASVGSTAPFVGLFGTVWGIMNSFQAIAASKQTNLAVVAPGIAEALFATALGLVAAIPAVIAYNKISTDLGRYVGRLESFADDFLAVLSRESEER